MAPSLSGSRMGSLSPGAPPQWGRREWDRAVDLNPGFDGKGGQPKGASKFQDAPNFSDLDDSPQGYGTRLGPGKGGGFWGKGKKGKGVSPSQFDRDPNGQFDSDDNWTPRG